MIAILSLINLPHPLVPAIGLHCHLVGMSQVAASLSGLAMVYLSLLRLWMAHLEMGELGAHRILGGYVNVEKRRKSLEDMMVILPLRVYQSRVRIPGFCGVWIGVARSACLETNWRLGAEIGTFSDTLGALTEIIVRFAHGYRIGQLGTPLGISRIHVRCIRIMHLLHWHFRARPPRIQSWTHAGRQRRCFSTLACRV